jgi:hypothetical protein
VGGVFLYVTGQCADVETAVMNASRSALLLVVPEVRRWFLSLLGFAVSK